MGCTSSAQNMPPSLANSGKEHSPSEEEGHALEETQMSLEKGVESNVTQVLPSCDIVDEPGPVDSLSKPHKDSSPDLEKDSLGNGHLMEGENLHTEPVMNTVSLQDEEKLSSLEEVVEKVVELYENGDLEIKSNEVEESITEEKQINLEDPNKIEGTREEDEDAHQEAEQAEEPASPSQSASSRATRWEALADIAAELPPSLAVDPLTGQIYALSKH